MLRSSESETEILLGNKQLVGIFFLVAVLLGIAFTSGFMIGRNGAARKESATAVAQDAPAQPANTTGGETHAVSPVDSGLSTGTADPGEKHASENYSDDQPLGSPHRGRQTAQQSSTATALPVSATGFTPQSGQEFLQVAAVSRPDANEVADVLRKKGFRAHAVPIAGNPSLFRVIVGPIRDAGDLANTRDSLRKTGFRDVIVQRYH